MESSLYHGDDPAHCGISGELPLLVDNPDHEEEEKLKPVRDPSRLFRDMNRQAWELPALTCTSTISAAVIMGWSFKNSNTYNDVLPR